MKFDAFFLVFIQTYRAENWGSLQLACHCIAGLYTVVYPGVTSPQMSCLFVNIMDTISNTFCTFVDERAMFASYTIVNACVSVYGAGR